ncbi:MAG: hypothetical protein AAGH64_05365 [Planctomycetota bacterium]
MGRTRFTRSLYALTLTALASTVIASGPVEWAQSVWDSATNGDGTTVTRLGEPTGQALLPSLSEFKSQSAGREQARLTRLDELSAELTRAIAESDHEETLRVLLEKQDLEGDPADFASRADVVRVTDEAARAARGFEASNEWLPAFRL